MNIFSINCAIPKLKEGDYKFWKKIVLLRWIRWTLIMLLENHNHLLLLRQASKMLLIFMKRERSQIVYLKSSQEP